MLVWCVVGIFKSKASAMQEQNAVDERECLNCPPAGLVALSHVGLPANPVLIVLPCDQRAVGGEEC